MLSADLIVQNIHTMNWFLLAKTLMLQKSKRISLKLYLILMNTLLPIKQCVQKFEFIGSNKYEYRNSKIILYNHYLHTRKE